MDKASPSTSTAVSRAESATIAALTGSAIARARTLHLRAREVNFLTGTFDRTEQARWLSRRGIPHRIGHQGIPIIRRADYRACLPSTQDEAWSMAHAEETDRIARLFEAAACGLVYVIDEGSDDSPVKIGFASERAEDRIASLQTGNPRVLRLLCARPGSFEIEQHAHRSLGEHRLAGEWFARAPAVRRFLIVAIEVGYAEALETVCRYRVERP